MAKRGHEEAISSGNETVDDVSDKSRSTSVEAEAHTPKYQSVEPTEMPVMRCALPPHKPMSFSTYAEYDSHYQQSHTNRCTECKKNFPSGHLLDLHIVENHDPIVASKREEGEKTYACFVEGCEKVCRDWKKRRSHLVDKHGFPKNYDFLVVDHGIDGRRSMLRPGIDAQGHRKSSRERGRSESSLSANTQTTEATSVSEPIDRPTSESVQPSENTTDQRDSKAFTTPVGRSTVDELTSSMSALKMVPRSITFGQRKGRSGLAES